MQSNLLVCPYFHVVFTIPEGLHGLFYINQRVCYNLLFQAAWQSLQKLVRNPQFLSAQPGAVAVLHTWGDAASRQTLTYHPHIHMLVPAGGLSKDGTEWISAHKKFLVPVKVLSRVFRGVFWSLLEKQLLKQKVKLPDDIPNLSVLKDLVNKKAWNVYAKKPLGSSKSAVEYLGKYTHRVAKSNSRLIKMEDGKISFKWKDYRTNGNRKLMTLSAEEFIRRFMQHILPSGFYKIRYYGLLALVNGAVRQHCAMLIGRVQPVALLQGLPARLVFKIVSGYDPVWRDPDCCPKCKQGKMIAKTILDPV